MPVLHDILPDPSPELLLLLAAVGQSADESGADLQRLAAGAPDWDRLLALARRHHVSPALCRGLRRFVWPLVPAGIRQRLEQALAANLRRNVLIDRRARGVVEAFREADIPVLAYKGVFIAQAVYGQLSSREVRDIDLLTGPEHAERAGRLLVSFGFQPVQRLDQQQVYRNSRSHIDVDLHWQLVPAYFPLDYDFGALWGRAVEVNAGTWTFRAPAPEDLLLLLAIQVAKDCWERRQRLTHLQKVCDVAEVVRRTPMLDWDIVQIRAERQGLARVQAFVLDLAAGLLGATLPPDVVKRVDSDRVALALARQVCAMPALGDTAVPPDRNDLLDLPLRLRQLRFYLRLRERRRDTWSYPGHVAFALARSVARAGS